MADPPRLYGLNALVTNAAGGIGEAVARTLVKHGASVLAVDSDNSGVEQHFAAVKGIEGMSTSYLDPAKLPVMIASAADRLGGIDVLVNDFALHPDAPLTSVDDQFKRLVQARSELTMAMCQAALPHLKKSPSGRIVNVGFLRSCFAADGGEAFAQAREDLAALTRALAADCGEFGITANYVQPGAIMTPRAREVFRKDTALRDFCISASAAGRVGEPVDVAKVVLFLASDDAVFVSGTGIAVDGGWVAG